MHSLVDKGRALYSGVRCSTSRWGGAGWGAPLAEPMPHTNNMQQYVLIKNVFSFSPFHDDDCK